MITNTDIAEVELGPEDIKIAAKEVYEAETRPSRLSCEFGFNPHRTLIGFLGEQALFKFLKLKESPIDYEFDIIYRGWRIDVKTTACNFKPPLKENFYAIANSSKPNEMTIPKSDFYVFIRLHKDKIKHFDRAWIVGYMSVGEFIRKGRYLPLGYKEPGIEVRTSPMTVLPIPQLHPIENLVNIKEKDT